MTLNQLIEHLEQLRDSEPGAGNYNCAVWKSDECGPGQLIEGGPTIENIKNYIIESCRPRSEVSDKIILIW